MLILFLKRSVIVIKIHIPYFVKYDLNCCVKITMALASHQGLWIMMTLKLFQFTEYPYVHFNLLFRCEDPSPIMTFDVLGFGVVPARYSIAVA